MTAPSREQLRAAWDAETPPGDTYGLGMGALVCPGGSIVAVAQNDDETASVLIEAYRQEFMNQPTKEPTCPTKH
jgi:hypothetical protein